MSITPQELQQLMVEVEREDPIDFADLPFAEDDLRALIASHLGGQMNDVFFQVGLLTTIGGHRQHRAVGLEHPGERPQARHQIARHRPHFLTCHHERQEAAGIELVAGADVIEKRHGNPKETPTGPAGRRGHKVAKAATLTQGQ